MEAAVTLEVVTHREVSVDQDQATNKSQSDTLEMKALTLTKLCCTKSRKSYCNKRTWEEAAEVMVDTLADTHQVDMEEFQAATAHPKSNHLMAHPDMDQAELLELISVMLSKDTKSLSS